MKAIDVITHFPGYGCDPNDSFIGGFTSDGATTVNENPVREFEILAGVFIAVGLLGLWTVGHFLGYPEAWAKPMIVAVEVALMPTLVLVLALLMNGVPARTSS